MNEADEEILAILKETFRSKKGELIDPDEAMRELFLKLLLGMSVLGIATWVITAVFDYESSQSIHPIAATPISLFFGLLFIHINNKSKNSSVIVFALTWVTVVLGLSFS